MTVFLVLAYLPVIYEERTRHRQLSKGARLVLRPVKGVIESPHVLLESQQRELITAPM